MTFAPFPRPSVLPGATGQVHLIVELKMSGWLLILSEGPSEAGQRSLNPR